MMNLNRLDRLKPHWPKNSDPLHDQAPPGEGRLQQTLTEWTGRAEALISNHPKVTVAAAVSLGLALGWLVKRR